MHGRIPGALQVRPQNVSVQEVIPPIVLAKALPTPYETVLDRDLARLVYKANKYGGEFERESKRKYEKYVFLAGLLLANRGLPPAACPDDPDDVYVRICNFYLANPSRLGSGADVLLANTLMKGRRHHHHHHHHHRRRKDREEKERSERKSSKRRSASRASSTSASSEWD